MKRVSVTAALLAVVLSALVNDASSEEYDDPAVAICEFLHLGGTLPQGNEYKRLDATIKGDRVKITYQRSQLNTKPIESVYGCFFNLVDGKFQIFLRYGEEQQACRDRFEEFGDDILKRESAGELTADEMTRLTDFRRECNRVVFADLQAYNRKADLNLLKVHKIHIHPIDPTLTTLQGKRLPTLQSP